MSKPFFIWTMRRTGGTSLTTLLTDISEYNGIEHEPFNADRILGRYIKEFRGDIKVSIIENELDDVFTQRPLIKHCYELFGKEFNELIVNSTVKQDYTHLFLKRENEVLRIVSLFLAQQTSVWGPEQKKQKYDDIIAGKIQLAPFDIQQMVEHYKWCRNITRKVQNMLADRGEDFKEITFEDFYTGERSTRIDNLLDLFEYLGFNKNTVEKYKNEIEEKIFNSSQNSKDIIQYIPNASQAIEILTNLSTN